MHLCYPMLTSSVILNSDMIIESDRSNYQILTICDQFPTILKCSNKQHYLMIQKIIYGLSPRGECSLLTKTDDCTSLEIASPIYNDFNCTGSNICLFYPEVKVLNFCQHAKSNLTQIHLTCVNLGKVFSIYLM